MGDQGPLKVLAEGIGHPFRVGAGLRDLSAARRPLLQPAHWGLSCPRLRAPSHPWVEVAPSWVSGCCPFPREPAQTRVHIHTHGQVQAATPSVRLSTLPPAPQAPWLPSSQFSRSLPPQEPPSPAPVLVPSPTWLQRSLPREAWQGGGQLWGASRRGGPAEARAPAPAEHWPVPGQAGLALRTPGPPVGCSTESWIPRNAFGKDLFLNTKSAPPASCGNPTFCSPAFWSPRLSSVHRSIRLFICSVLSRGKLGGRKGEERVRKREGRKRNWKGGK